MAKLNFNLQRLLGLFAVLILFLLSFYSPSPLERMEKSLLDNSMRLDFSDKGGSHNIVLIEIDEKSLKEVGPWPWPRNIIATMINRLHENGVELIGVNIPFTSEQQKQGLNEVRAFRDQFDALGFGKESENITEWIMKNLATLEERLNNDKKLTESVLLSGNVILPVYEKSGQGEDKLNKEEDIILSRNLLMQGKSAIFFNRSEGSDSISLPFRELAKNVLGLGHGKTISDGVTANGSHPILTRYGSFLLPSFPFRIAIAHLSQQPRQVLVDKNRIRLKDRTIPLFNGEMLIRFQAHQEYIPRYSFSDILLTRQMSPLLKNKIVLIGMNVSGSPQISTPFSTS